MTESLTVLAVCTGNICRSPAMERMLAAVLHAEPDVRVISAGTHAHSGEDMQPLMKQRVSAYGADVQSCVAEQVTAEMIKGAALIVAATGVHIDDMLAEVPQAEERMFTLPEFARLLGHLDPAEVSRAAGPEAGVRQQLTAMIPLAHRVRDSIADGSEDEIVDPYMLPESVYDESFRQIREAVEAVGQALNLR